MGNATTTVMLYPHVRRFSMLMQITRFTPVLKYETINIDKILRIISDQNILVGTRVGSNHFIPVLILFVFVLLLKLCQYRSVMPGCLLIKILNSDSCEDAMDSRPALLWFVAVAYTVFQFRIGDNRNAHIFPR